ncbi:hypothetical protein F4780DRAFT_783022 [Xylariomycetidae sp. FL0641]|nr:hypothetical protein F4780DRAFT_783022 [Xylariomycetidae sp. FL0641]
MTIKRAQPKCIPTESCCTCATLLAEVPGYSETEKPLPAHRWLDCCPRVICGRCIHDNDRFESYCPYCQVSTSSSALPPGLKAPPTYDSIAAASAPLPSGSPPPYSADPALASTYPRDKKSDPPEEEAAEDTLHFLHQPHDTVASLSLRYGVPASVLRRANNLTSDHLLLARRTVLIPGTHYRAGVSLSPRPVEGEEEEARKAKIRRFMVACKVPEYDVALLYLDQAAYDLDRATEAYFADEEWERAHPAAARAGKGVARGGRVGDGWRAAIPRRGT